MTDTFYVCSANRTTVRVYHTDPECRQLSEEAREVDREHIDHRDLRECRRCAGTADTSREDMTIGLYHRIRSGEVDI